MNEPCKCYSDSAGIGSTGGLPWEGGFRVKLRGKGRHPTQDRRRGPGAEVSVRGEESVVPSESGRRGWECDLGSESGP